MADGRGGFNRRILMWGPVAIYVLVIFYVSSLSNPPGVPPVPHFDKLVHFLEYGVLGFLLGRALGLTGLVRRYRVLFVAALAIGACVGMADEIYQGTVAGRERSLADFLADLAGLFVASILLRVRAMRGRAGA